MSFRAVTVCIGLLYCFSVELGRNACSTACNTLFSDFDVLVVNIVCLRELN